MTANQIKYIHISTTNKPCMWKSINLTNLAQELTAGEADKLIPELTAKLIGIANSRIAHLKGLKAPPIILDNEVKVLDKLNAGKHPDLNILKRVMRTSV